MPRALVIALCLSSIIACKRPAQGPGQGRSASAAAPSPAAAPTRAASADSPPVHVEMKNVRLHIGDGVALDVRRLRGDMISRVAGRPPVFDNQESYVLRLTSAEVSMDFDSLGNLMNRYLFAYEGAPLKDVTVGPAEGGQLAQKGKLHKGIDVPFSMTAAVSATPDGRLRLHVESMKTAGIPVKGLMKLLGLKLEDVVDLKQRRGIVVEENDIILAPGLVLPPPRIRGSLTHAEVSGGRLVQIFGGTDVAPKTFTYPDPRARNYIYFHGGELSFGKLTMHDADLQLVDMDDKDIFDFHPARYELQLIAGYSKNTAQQGLATYMPDFDDVRGNVAGKADRRH